MYHVVLVIYIPSRNFEKKVETLVLPYLDILVALPADIGTGSHLINRLVTIGNISDETKSHFCTCYQRSIRLLVLERRDS